MAKIARPRVATKERLDVSSFPEEVSVALHEVAASAREGLLALSVATGLAVMSAIFESDVKRVVGPKGKHDPERTAHRHGTEDAHVVLGGRQVPVDKPRVRSLEAIARGLSARSVLQIHRILHSAFRQAVRWRLLSVNPSDGVSPPSPSAPILISPDPEQIARLLEAADERMRPPLAVLAGLGLRRGEVVALRWDAVELDVPSPSLMVVGSLQRADGVLKMLPPKTERSKRTIPLPASISALLRRVRIEQNERRLIAGAAWRAEGFVFDRCDGGPLDPDSLTKAFGAARRRSGVQGVRLHDLRHAFATLHMKSGTNARVVSDLLGHATVSFTLQTYSHPDAQMAAAAMETIDVALGATLDR